MNQSLLLQETAVTTAATTIADLQHIRYLDGNEYNSKTRNDLQSTQTSFSEFRFYFLLFYFSKKALE